MLNDVASGCSPGSLEIFLGITPVLAISSKSLISSATSNFIAPLLSISVNCSSLLMLL